MLTRLLKSLPFFLLALEIAPIPARAGISVSHGKEMTASSATDSLEILDSLISRTRISNTALARSYGALAKSVGERLGTPEALAESWCLSGKAYPLTKCDSGYYCYSRALEIADSFGLERQKAHIFYNMALLYQTAYDYKNAMTLLDSSLRLAKSTGDFPTMADGCNTMGNLRYAVGDLPGSTNWYKQAYEIAARYRLLKQQGTALGNLAEEEEDDKIYFRMMKEAIHLLNESHGCEFEIASFLNNMGLRQKNPDSSLFLFRKSLKFAEGGTIPEIEVMANNNMAYSYLDLGDLRSAETCLTEHAIPVALNEKNQDWLSTLYDSYADVLTAKGDHKKAVSYMKLAMAARAESNKLAAAEQVRLLSAVLDLKNKEIAIKKGEAEILAGNERLRQNRLLLISSLLLIILLVFIILWIYQWNRMKLQKQQFDSARKIIGLEENEKENVARELHDITGQLIMGINAGFDHPEINRKHVREEIRSKMSDLGSRIRQISHRMGRSGMKRFSFEELMETLCDDMQLLAGISVKLELKIPGTLSLEEDQVLHLYRITQELLTNAGKYAKGSQVEIIIAICGKRLVYTYSDNGPGFQAGKEPVNGIGIRNIRERAVLLGGEAELNAGSQQGTTWKISVPLKSKATRAQC